MAQVPSGSIRVVSAEIQIDGRYLICQRYAKAVLPLLWEFPGGRVRDGQTDQERLIEAVSHRIGVEATVGELLLEKVHTYADYEVTLVVYRCKIDGKPWAHHVNSVAWVAPETSPTTPSPGLTRRLWRSFLRMPDF